MGYSKKGKNPRTSKSRHRGLFIGLVLLVVCSISTGLLFVLKANKSSPDSFHEPTPEERENNTLHIKSFLGYEFGQCYSPFVILPEPWFGFTQVELNKTVPNGPLYSLTFYKKTVDNVRTIFKNSDEQQGREEYWDLVQAIAAKYNIDFSVRDENQAIYYGKYTEIRIEHRQGTLHLEITDIEFQKKRLQLFSEEVGNIIKKRNEATRQNMQRDYERKKRDADRM